MSRLSPTARVILGLLRLGPHTGYEIKQTTDRSTQFFWGASYGQIYPELRRLEEAGLAVAAEEPRGGVRRRVYRITPAGMRAVQEWLTGDDDEFGVRDEGLLKLFFGAALDGDQLAELVRRRQVFFEDVAAHFRKIGDELGPIDNPSAEVLTYGIELMVWNAAWWADLGQRLATAGEQSPGEAG
jgi:DNA-binding PadR family transcriptional regulator